TGFFCCRFSRRLLCRRFHFSHTVMSPEMWNRTTLINSTGTNPRLSGTIAQKISAKQLSLLEIIKKINLIQIFFMLWRSNEMESETRRERREKAQRDVCS